jgi:hypothetical protein
MENIAKSIRGPEGWFVLSYGAVLVAESSINGCGVVIHFR